MSALDRPATPPGTRLASSFPGPGDRPTKDMNGADRIQKSVVRDTADSEAERAARSSSSPRGSWMRPWRRVETPASIRSGTVRDNGSRSVKC